MVQRVGTAGALIGPEVQVALGQFRPPKLVWHPGTGDYLVTWDEPTGNAAIFAQRLTIGPEPKPATAR